MLPARQRLSLKLEHKAPARAINIPLIMLLARHLGYADETLSLDLVYGVGIIGKIDSDNSLSPRDTSATTIMELAKQNLRVGNGSILKALSNASDPVLKQKRLGHSVEESRRVWLSELKPVTKFDWRNSAPPPRFCIAQQRGLQGWK